MFFGDIFLGAHTSQPVWNLLWIQHWFFLKDWWYTSFHFRCLELLVFRSSFNGTYNIRMVILCRRQDFNSFIFPQFFCGNIMCQYKTLQSVCTVSSELSIDTPETNEICVQVDLISGISSIYMHFPKRVPLNIGQGYAVGIKDIIPTRKKIHFDSHTLKNSCYYCENKLLVGDNNKGS